MNDPPRDSRYRINVSTIGIGVPDHHRMLTIQKEGSIQRAFAALVRLDALNGVQILHDAIRVFEDVVDKQDVGIQERQGTRNQAAVIEEIPVLKEFQSH